MRFGRFTQGILQVCGGTSVRCAAQPGDEKITGQGGALSYCAKKVDFV